MDSRSPCWWQQLPTSPVDMNPAVSLGLALAGQITIIRLVLCWIAQILGAIAGAWVLQLVSTGEVVPIHTVGVGESLWGAMLIEIVLTFTLVFVVFATAADPKKGPIGTIAPLAIGFTVLAWDLRCLPGTGPTSGCTGWVLSSALPLPLLSTTVSS
jgi:aquaporin TIP